MILKALPQQATENAEVVQPQGQGCRDHTGLEHEQQQQQRQRRRPEPSQHPAASHQPAQPGPGGRDQQLQGGQAHRQASRQSCQYQGAAHQLEPRQAQHRLPTAGSQSRQRLPMPQCGRIHPQDPTQPQQQRQQGQKGHHHFPPTPAHAGLVERQAARHRPAPPQLAHTSLQQQHHHEQHPQTTPEFVKLERLQSQLQFRAQTAKAEHSQQGGTAQRTFEPIAAVTQHPGQQGRAQGCQQSGGSRSATGAQGLQIGGGESIEQIAHNPGHKGGVRDSDRQHGHHRL